MGVRCLACVAIYYVCSTITSNAIIAVDSAPRVCATRKVLPMESDDGINTRKIPCPSPKYKMFNMEVEDYKAIGVCVRVEWVVILIRWINSAKTVTSR